MFALDCRRRHQQWCGKTYRPVLHEFEAGAKISQADVAVHIQQNVVRFNVPGIRWRRKKSKLCKQAGTKPVYFYTKQNAKYD